MQQIRRAVVVSGVCFFLVHLILPPNKHPFVFSFSIRGVPYYSLTFFLSITVAVAIAIEY
jgi:hypothetical protein